MTLTIELTPSEEALLAAAAQQEGVDPAELVRKLVIERLPPLAERGLDEDPTLALFAQWEQEDAAMTPGEVAEENRLWEGFKTHVNAERDRAGTRRVF
jgi:hypothetical protein